jgi:hypothetical protein
MKYHQQAVDEEFFNWVCDVCNNDNDFSVFINFIKGNKLAYKKFVQFAKDEGFWEEFIEPEIGW